MTPKEQYEARKAERKRIAEEMKNNYTLRQQRTDEWMFDMLDRFVTAVERIAEVMERTPQEGETPHG